MTEDNPKYWQRKLMLGKGTQKDFKKDYEHINGMRGCFTTASQLTETGTLSEEKNLIYEYRIYYNAKPEQEATHKGSVKNPITSEEVDLQNKSEIEMEEVKLEL